MRIEDNNTGTSALGQTAATQVTSSTTPKSSPTTSSSSQAPDGLELSQFAGSLSKILQSDSASRAQRVAQLGAAVRSGTYQVDPQAVSRALVDHVVSISQSAQ